VQAERLRTQVKVLADAVRAFAESENDLPRLLATIARELARVVGGFCAIAMPSPDGRVLDPAAYFDDDDSVLALFRRLLLSTPAHVDSDVPSARVFRTGELSFTPSVDDTFLARRYSGDDLALVREVHISSWLILALRVQGSSIGILSLLRHGRGAAPLDEDEIRLAQLLADHAALAIQNARQIAERKNLEDQLRQSQKMEAIGTLAGGIAHDFNNVLSVIMGYAQIVLDEVPRDSHWRTDLEEVVKAGARASALTRQILAFSRKQILQPEVLDPNEACRALAPMLRRLLGEHIDLRVHLDAEVGRIKADASQLEQVIMNLAVNARDAMPSGGQLTIETANVELDDAYVRTHLESAAGPHVMIAVTDTGHGMDKELTGRIFEPFFTTKVRGKGTGLGLSTVFGIVKQSGGSIWVYSERGRGTTFKVYFPRTDEVLAPGAEKDVSTTLTGSETILVVEDEEMLRKLTSIVLERAGYRVLVAATGDEALRLLDDHVPVDLLLTDVVMPKMSGNELADIVRARRPAMRILFMSGYTENTIAHHGVLDEGVSFIAKPLTPELLLAKVRASLL
jgi:signal transduction histidine kinase/CheY-like chemotaxis protein